MPAKFLTVDEVQRQRDRAIQIGAEHVERLLLRTWNRFWQSRLFLPAYELRKIKASRIRSMIIKNF